MSTEQKNRVELPPYTMTQVTLPSDTLSVRKQRSTKKYVIVAVSGVAVTALILTAFLVGAYFFHSSQKELLKFAVNVDKDSKQEVTSDPNNNVVQYYVRNPNYDLWVIDDFNRDIQTLKVKDQTDTVCYLTPLNRSVSVTPSDISKDQSKKIEQVEGKNTTSDYIMKYRVSGTPIPDTSFLSKTASSECKGISTYWVYPYCDNVREEENKKQKRDICKRTYFWCCKRGFLGIGCKVRCIEEITYNC